MVALRSWCNTACRFKLLVCAAALGMGASGCSRNSLQSRVLDAGSPPSIEAGSATGSEVQSLPGPEVGLDGPELRLDPEVGDGPIGAGPEAGDGPLPDRELESGREVQRPLCENAPKTAKVLAKLEGLSLPSAMVVQDGSVFIGRQGDGASSAPFSGWITRVVLAIGDQLTYPLGPNIPNQLVGRTGELFWSQGKATAVSGGGWSFSYTEVGRLKVATTQVSVVDNAPFATTVAVPSVIATKGGEIYWQLAADAQGGSVVKHWEASSGTPIPNTRLTGASWLLADDLYFYWSERSLSLVTDFISEPIHGGADTIVYESAPGALGTPSLLAVDGDRLYYTVYDVPAPGIRALPTVGGPSVIIVPTADPLLLDNHTIDDTHVYWVDRSDQSTIRRIAKDGTGGIQIFWRAESGSRGIGGIAMDDCNVYWTAGPPEELFVVGK